MRTLYLVEREYVNKEYSPISAWTTLDEAKAIASKIKKNDSYGVTGSWQIIARTIDEERFTVEDTVIETYNYDRETEILSYCKKWVAIYKKEIEYIESIVVTNEATWKRKQERLTYLKGQVDSLENQIKKRERT